MRAEDARGYAGTGASGDGSRPFGFLVRLQQGFWPGLHRHGNAQIYVSRGTGYWGPPMRLAEPAEITHLTLESTQVA